MNPDNSGLRTSWKTIRIRRGILSQTAGEVTLVNNRRGGIIKDKTISYFHFFLFLLDKDDIYDKHTSTK